MNMHHDMAVWWLTGQVSSIVTIKEYVPFMIAITGPAHSGNQDNYDHEAYS